MGQLSKTRLALLGLAILLGSMVAASPAAAQNELPLTVTKTGPTTAVVGEVLTFTVIVTNNGSAAATNVVMTDFVPTITRYTNVIEPANWSCATPAVGDWGDVVCSLTGPLAPAESATFTVVLTAAEAGVTKNDALIRADGHDDGYVVHDFTIGATPAPTPEPSPTPTVAPSPTPTVAPTPTPTAEQAPTATAAPTTRPEPTPTVDGGTSPGGGDGDVGAGGGAAPDGGSLPATGSDATTMSMLAMVAIASGALLVMGGLVLRPDAIAATARHARSVAGRRDAGPR